MELDYLDGFRLSKAELKLSRDKVKKKKKKHHTLFSYVAKLCRKGSRKFVTWLWVLVRAQVCDWNMTIPKFWHRRPWGKINLRKRKKKNNNNNMGPAKNAG